MPAKTKLLIQCPDRSGIVHAVTGFVQEQGGNILDSQQHSMEEQFFMRLEIEGLEASEAELIGSFQAVADKYSMQFKFQTKKKKLGILVSKYDHCLYDILLKQQYGELDVEIPIIISNHPDLEKVAQVFGINYMHLPIPAAEDPEQKQKNKAQQEIKIIETFKEMDIDFIAMARYMQILSAEFIAEFPMQIINVHHGFLPAFKGARPYHQAYEKGVKIIGATSHYATEDLDMGPIIAQDVIPVAHRNSVNDYIAKGRDVERLVLAKALKAHAEDKVIVFKNRTIVFD